MSNLEKNFAYKAQMSQDILKTKSNMSDATAKICLNEKIGNHAVNSKKRSFFEVINKSINYKFSND